MTQHIPPTGSMIPEVPARIIRCEEVLRAEGVWARCGTRYVKQEVPESLVAECFGQKFLETAQRASTAAATRPFQHGDIYWSAGTWQASRIAAQAAIDATQHALSAVPQDSQSPNSPTASLHSFALIRPPGHHCYDLPAGFCILNNIAMAAHSVLTADSAARVAIVDWDYHFGDGTAETFVGDERVMFVSLHAAKTRDGWKTYPTSPLKGDSLRKITEGRSWNIKWIVDDADDAAWAYAFKQLIVPSLREFAPTVILVSAGFDAVKGDTLAGMNLTPRAFGCAAHALTEVGVPVVAVLEGGYDTDLLAASVSHTIRGLLGDAEYSDWRCGEPAAQHKTVVDQVVGHKAALRIKI